MFHAVISNRENIFLGEARSSFYYGSVFPFFLVFLLVVDMMRVKQIALRNILGVSWMALFVWNTYAINAYWIKNHHWQWKQFFPQERGEPEHHIGFNVERKSWKH